jgi:hypothetical protein
MCKSLVRLSDPPQYALVCLVQAFRQLLQNMPNTWWEAVSQDFQLAEHPAEPISCFEIHLKVVDEKPLHAIRYF